MTIDPTPNTPPHRARKVIDAALDAWLHDDGGESTRADQILSALAAEGLAIYDTATHAAVPREEAEWQPLRWWDPETEPPAFPTRFLCLDDRGLLSIHNRHTMSGYTIISWRRLPLVAEAQGGKNGS